MLHLLDINKDQGKNLESSESSDSRVLRERWQANERRGRLDLSAGFTDLRHERRDSLVRQFVDKLKEKQEASRVMSNKFDNLNDEEDKSDFAKK